MLQPLETIYNKKNITTSHSFFVAYFLSSKHIHTLDKMRLLLRPPPPCLQSHQSFTRPNSHFSTTSSSSCSSSSSSSSSSFSIFSFKPLNKRFHFLNPPHSSLKQTKKQQQRTTTTLQTNNNTPPQSSIKRLLNLNNTNNNSNNNNNDNNDDENENENGNAIKGTIVAGLLLVGGVGGFGTLGYIYRDQINAFLIQFSSFIEGYGPAGYALFVAVYAGLEVLAIPAIPLTMSAGLLFGSVTGTILVSISGTVAASVAFLIARYFARDRILKMVEGNKKFLAIDKAIGENGFRVVTLLRLSPLLPFSLGNYLYGLTSVKFVPYVLGSWLGMLPGTWAYVSAGAFGRAIIQEESELGLTGGTNQLLTLGVGLLATALAATYVTQLAKDAMKDIDE